MAYGPPEFVTPDLAPDEVRAAPAPVLGFSGGHPLAAEPLPPLPRPRPAKLAARKAAENAKPAIRRSTEIVSAPAAATSASPSTAAAKGARPSSFQAD